MLGRVPVVVFFIAALFGAAVGLHAAVPLLALAAAVFVALAAGVIVVTSPNPAARGTGLVVVVTVAAVIAGVAADAAYEATSAALPSSSGIAVVEGVVVDEMPADEGRRLLLDVDAVVDDGSGVVPPIARGAHGTIAIKLFAAVDVHAGDRLRVRARLHRAEPALSPATYDAYFAARSKQVHASLSIHDVDDAAVLARGTAPLLVQARTALRDRLTQQVPPRLAGLLLALLIGDVSLFEDEQNTAYRHVGAGHLLAVSGLQVTLLAVVLMRFFGGVFLLLAGGRRRRSQVLAAAVALLGVWAFVGICGMPPSAVRAAVMASAVVVGQLRGRRVLLIDAIAAAGLLTVLVSPASVDDAGFLLSYAAVIGLAATSVGGDVDDGSTGAIAALWQKVKPALIASLTAGFATVPLSAWLFGQFAPAGLVANIVLVPVASLLQLPSLLCGLLGAVTGWSWLTWIGGEAALLLEALVFGFAEILPGVRAVEPPSVAVAVVGISASLFAGAMLMLQRRGPAVVAVVVAVAIWSFSAYEPRALRVTFLPVGQGDGAVIELPDGTVFVVDAGGRVPFDPRATDEGRAEALAEPGKRVVVPYLQRRGIEHVDVVVVSHPHPDHAGGLRAVVEAVSVGELWIAGDATRPGRLMAPLISAVGVDKTKSTPALLGTHIYGTGDDAAVVEVLAPAPEEGAPTYPELHANDNSLVMRVCWKQTCILMPGDLEEQGEELLLASVPADKLRAQIVKAGHHGSRTSSSPAFVAATKAEHVVLCTGRHNTFNFPSPVVVDRWRAAGATLWDTARHGELRIVLDGERVQIRPFRVD
ncbi:MAG TPA: DNA internalization-related competence protein ComEC/Rec2 [Myxococcota bacterium]